MPIFDQLGDKPALEHNKYILMEGENMAKGQNKRKAVKKKKKAAAV